jgi:hypothetical protein
MIRKSGLIVAIYLMLTFSSGVAVGALGFWLYSTRTVNADTRRVPPEEYRRRALQEYQTRLKLSPEQVEKLTAILDATRELFNQLADKHRPEYQAVQQHQADQIRAILNEEQRVEYEKIRAEREKHRKGRSGMRKPGPF